MAESSKFHGWPILAASFLILVIDGGVRFSFGVLIKPLISEFNWERGAITFAYTLNMLVFACCQPIAGKLLDRFGPRRLFSIAALVTTTGLVLTAQARSLAELYGFYGVITAAGTAGISISVISSMLSRWFERLRVFVSGIAISGTALGQFLFIPLIALLLETFGWRWTWSILGMLLSVLIVPISLFVIRSNPARDGAASPKSLMRAETVSRELSSARDSNGAAPVLLSRNFLLLGASYFICGFQDFLFVTQMIPFVTDWGFSMQEASNLQGWAGLLSVPGVLIFSAASEKLGRKLPLFLTFVPRVICFFLLVFADGPRTVYAAALLFGFTLMASAPLGAAIVAELYGLRHVGTLTGVIFWVHHLGGALGAYVGGITYDLTGSYSAAFAAALALAVIALLTSATIDRPRTGTRE